MIAGVLVFTHLLVLTGGWLIGIWMGLNAAPVSTDVDDD